MCHTDAVDRSIASDGRAETDWLAEAVCLSVCICIQPAVSVCLYSGCERTHEGYKGYTIGIHAEYSLTWKHPLSPRTPCPCPCRSVRTRQAHANEQVERKEGAPRPAGTPPARPRTNPNHQPDDGPPAATPQVKRQRSRHRPPCPVQVSFEILGIYLYLLSPNPRHLSRRDKTCPVAECRHLSRNDKIFGSLSEKVCSARFARGQEGCFV